MIGTIPAQWDARPGNRRDHDREQATKLPPIVRKLYHVCARFAGSVLLTFTMIAQDLSDRIKLMTSNNVR